MAMSASAQVPQMSERSVNISEFIDARGNEIMDFKSRLELKFAESNKLPYQNVKKHLRRRAMSHNRYRIPARIRRKLQRNGQEFEKELIATEELESPVRCRKAIRKSKLLMECYTRRTRTHKWLETHLWHAKRMKMGEYFGYKVALKTNEKSDRACYRLARNEAVLYDKSYFVMFEIFLEKKEELEIEALRTILQRHIERSDIKKIFENKHISRGFKMLDECLFYSNYTTELQEIASTEKFCDSFELIGPSEVLWTAENRLLLIVHPACKEAVEQNLLHSLRLLEAAEYKSLTIRRIEDNYCLFEVIGPQTLQKISLLLENLYPCLYPRNLVLTANCEGTYSKKLTMPPRGFAQDVLEEENKISAASTQQSDIDSAIIRLAGAKIESPRPVNDIFDAITHYEVQTFQKRFKVTTRRRYTHKKKGKTFTKKEKSELIKKTHEKEAIIQSEEIELEPVVVTLQTHLEQKIGMASGLSIISERAVSKNAVEARAHSDTPVEEQEMIDEVVVTTNDTAKKEAQTDEMTFRLALILSGYGKGGQEVGSCTILVNQGAGHILWRLLSFLACKAIGLEEYNSILFEHGELNFPKDYPATEAYRSLQDAQAYEKSMKYLRRPGNRRVDYSALNSPFPFKPDWNFLLRDYLAAQESKVQTLHGDLTRVHVHFLQKGQGVEGGYICEANEEDLAKLKSTLYNSGGSEKIKHVYEEVKVGEDANLQLEPSDSEFPLIKTERKIIGFFTSAAFSQKAAHATGTGHVLKYYCLSTGEAQEVDREYRSRVFLALARKPTSRCYFFVKLTLFGDP